MSSERTHSFECLKEKYFQSFNGVVDYFDNCFRFASCFRRAALSVEVRIVTFTIKASMFNVAIMLRIKHFN